jgi:hypothetical protein
LLTLPLLLSINRLILFRFPIYRLEKNPTVKRYISQSLSSVSHILNVYFVGTMFINAGELLNSQKVSKINPHADIII